MLLPACAGGTPPSGKLQLKTTKESTCRGSPSTYFERLWVSWRKTQVPTRSKSPLVSREACKQLIMRHITHTAPASPDKARCYLKHSRERHWNLVQCHPDSARSHFQVCLECSIWHFPTQVWRSQTFQQLYCPLAPLVSTRSCGRG